MQSNQIKRTKEQIERRDQMAARLFIDPGFDWEKTEKITDPTAYLIAARNGDNEARERLILGYTRLAGSIAGGFAFKWRNKADDILAIAFELLVASVNEAIKSETITSDHLCKYIHVRVRGGIINHIRTDYTIMPARTIKIDQTKLEENKESTAEFFVRNFVCESLDVEGVQAAGSKDYEKCYISDIFESKLLTKIEKIVFELRYYGWTDEEIGAFCGTTRQYIRLVRSEAAVKIRKIITGEW
jgi:DNA-directed RNA polymerase specialized sigma subunit